MTELTGGPKKWDEEGNWDADYVSLASLLSSPSKTVIKQEKPAELKKAAGETKQEEKQQLVRGADVRPDTTVPDRRPNVNNHLDKHAMMLGGSIWQLFLLCRSIAGRVSWYANTNDVWTYAFDDDDPDGTLRRLARKASSDQEAFLKCWKMLVTPVAQPCFEEAIDMIKSVTSDSTTLWTIVQNDKLQSEFSGLVGNLELRKRMFVSGTTRRSKVTVLQFTAQQIEMAIATHVATIRQLLARR